MKTLLTAVTIAALCACTNNGNETSRKDSMPAAADRTETQTEPTAPATTDNPENDEACYVYILKRDTMVLHLITHGNDLSGKLSFDNYEKDGSSGSVRGTKQNDIIKLLYTFNSEGMKSVAEEYFKFSGQDLIRGTGELTNRGDTTFFTKPDKLTYNGGKFVRTDCNAVNSKYRQ